MTLGDTRSAPGIRGVAHSPQNLTISVCLLVLLVCCSGPGPVQKLACTVWLSAFAFLALTNAGAALGLYIAAVAIFATQYVPGLASPFERPDNYSLALLLPAVLLFHPRRPASRSHWLLMAAAAVFITYGLIQSALLGNLTRGTFAWFMRMFGIPFALYLVFSRLELPRRQLHALVSVLLLLSVFMVAISIVETIGWTEVLYPRWLLDPTLNRTLGGPRSGGLLMQSEWNGLAISLLLCVVVFATRWDQNRNPAMLAVLGALCLVAIFFTYTRAAWLGVAVGLSIILVQRSASWSGTALKRAAVAIGGIGVVAFLILFPTRLAESRLHDTGSVFFRLNLWRTAAAMAADRPLTGVGFGEFAEEASGYQQELSTFSEYAVTLDANSVLHNTFLSTLVELGAVGLVLYSLVVGWMIWMAWHRLRRSWGREAGWWVVAFSAVYLIQIQFVNAHEPTTNYLFFGFLAAASAAAASSSGMSQPDEAGPATHAPLA